MTNQATRIIGAALLLLAAIALVIAAVALLTRGDEVAPVMITAPERTAAPGQTPQSLRVHVSGAVGSPGVYEMSDGDRVMDAIAAAGGVQPGADLSSVNLARRVQDEGQYHIPLLGEPPAVNAPGFSTSASSPKAITQSSPGIPSSPLVDLNSATVQELQTLPGIGPVMASRIVAHRETNGPFTSVDDVENVPGIGPKTLESLRPLVTAGNAR